ncbi:MAG: hypothetical protein AB7P99_16470 [Vicinamibacterales bacterium]
MLILTFGAEGRAPEALAALVSKHRVDRVIDLRLTPGGREGRNGAWAGTALQAQFGARYLWLRACAVRNLRSGLAAGESPRFVDLDAGLRTLARYFGRDRAWVFLGDAPDPQHDARGWLAQRFQDDLAGIVVVHDRPDAPAKQEGLWG